MLDFFAFLDDFGMSLALAVVFLVTMLGCIRLTLISIFTKAREISASRGGFWIWRSAECDFKQRIQS